MHYQGKLVAGEAIADLGGVLIGYRALEHSLAGKPHDVIDGFTPEQRYFLAFGQSWTESVRPEAERTEALTDPHPIPRDRVNQTVANIPEWYSAFNCPKPPKPVCQSGRAGGGAPQARPRMDLTGRVAVVAGASGGIGTATVRALLPHGMRVVLAAPKDALLDAIVRETVPFGDRVLTVPTDITRRDEVDALVARALRAFGRIDALVNVAGIGSSPSFCDSSDDEIERVLAVNLLGPARLMHAVSR